MSNQSEVARKESNGGTSADPGGRAANAESTLRPAVDIFETDEGITLQADMPGVSKERLNVRVEGTNLLVEGEIAITRQEEMQALYADVRSLRQTLAKQATDQAAAVNALQSQLSNINAEEKKTIAILASDKPALRASRRESAAHA